MGAATTGEQSEFALNAMRTVRRLAEQTGLPRRYAGDIDIIIQALCGIYDFDNSHTLPPRATREERDRSQRRLVGKPFVLWLRDCGASAFFKGDAFCQEKIRAEASVFGGEQPSRLFTVDGETLFNWSERQGGFAAREVFTLQEACDWLGVTL